MAGRSRAASARDDGRARVAGGGGSGAAGATSGGRGGGNGGDERSTRDRILDAALSSFGTKGYDATSLDQLAADLGVRKQTILYYWPSKAELLGAVIDHSSVELSTAIAAVLAGAGPGFDRVEALVRAVFRLALRRPELLGLLREASRLGPPAATRLIENLEPMVEPATAFLEAEMAAGRFRQCDARLLLVSVYSTIVGVATEVEVLRAVGIEPTLRSTAIRRRELIEFLRSALVVDGRTTRSRRRR